MQIHRTLLGALLGSVVATAPASAQVVTDIEADGSLGPAGMVTDPDADGVFVIDEFDPDTMSGFGERKGGNLFHSFETFDVGTGDTALFTALGPTDIVFTRVTGGKLSEIDGTLDSDIFKDAARTTGADFYFLNPSGIALGENAFLDVPASFSASTADAVHFDDGTVWPTGTPTNGGLVTAATPTAFEFTGDAPAAITIDQTAPALIDRPLDLEPGETLSLVAGDVTIRGRNAAAGTIVIESGTVEIASVAGPAVVPLDVAAFDVDSLPADQLGTVALSDAAKIEVSGTSGNQTPGGRVVIRGGRLVAENAQIFSGTFGDSDGASEAIDIHVAGALSATRLELRSAALGGAGDGGDVVIRAGALRADDGSSFISLASSSGSGGDISIEADSIEIVDAAEVNTTATGTGAGGSIELGTAENPADRVRIADANSRLLSIGGAAPGGSVTVQSGVVEIVDGGQVVSLTGGASAAGNIDLGTAENPADVVRVAGPGSRVLALGGQGPGGSITVRSASIEITDAGQMTSQANGPAAAGNIDLGTPGNPAELVRIAGAGAGVSANGAQGPGGSVAIRADSVEIAGGGLVTVSANGTGDAGSITVEAGDVLLDGRDGTGNPSALVSQAIAGASGDAGNIAVDATDSLTIRDGARISVASRAVGSGATGSIDIETGTLEVWNSEDAILAESFDQDGGDIGITANVVRISNSSIRASARAGGDGGNIEFLAGSVLVDQGSSIEASAEVGGGGQSGDAGNITIAGGNVVRIKDASINTRSSTGSGGNVTIESDDVILLRRRMQPLDEALIDAQVAADLGSAQPPGSEPTGGNVTLVSDNVILDRAGIRASAGDFGIGGRVEIEADGFFASGDDLQEMGDGLFVCSDDCFIDVTGGFDSGSFEVRSPDAAVIPEIAALSEDFLDASELLADQCAAREERVGSLVLRGGDRAPAAPGDELRTLYQGDF